MSAKADQKLDPITPACYGVVCSIHKFCARYQAVDGSSASQKFIGSCDEGKMFVASDALIEANAAQMMGWEMQE